MRSTWWFGLCALLMTSPGPCPAAQVPLDPADTRIGLTVYALGLFAQDGHFTRFSGNLRFDPAHPTDCRVEVKVDAASLDMGAATRTRTALGTSMLDAAHYPDLLYAGACTPARTEGQLTLHGVRRSLTVSQTRRANSITATATLRRQDYGIHGLPALIGAKIDILFTMDLPPTLAEQLPNQ